MAQDSQEPVPIAGDSALTLSWEETRFVVRCTRCIWNSGKRLSRLQFPFFPSRSERLLFLIQSDIVTVLRGQSPSRLWFDTISASQFLEVINDLYWLLRTPGLSARDSQNFTFTDAFSWINRRLVSRSLFSSTQQWHFSAWDSESKGKLLLAMAATLLGKRVFDIITNEHHCPPWSEAFPLDWIFPALHNHHAQEFLRRVVKWPAPMRMRLRSAIAANNRKALRPDRRFIDKY